MEDEVMLATMNQTRCDLPEEVRHEMVSLLNERLADCLQVGLHAKHAHWNVRGPSFIGLHKLFDKVHEATESYADLLAERIAALGGTAEGTTTAIREKTAVAEYPVRTASGELHCTALADSLATLARSVRTAIDRAAAAPDAGTADLLTEISRGIDQYLWLVEAHLHDSESNDRWR
jgi:starvation-inducible DNA-binding protein